MDQSQKPVKAQRIATLQSQIIAEQSAEFKNEANRIQTEMKKRGENLQKKLQPDMDEMKRLEQKFSSPDQSKWTDPKAIQADQKRYKELAEKISAEFQALEQWGQAEFAKLQTDMQKKVKTATERVAKRLGFNVVVADVVVYADPEFDITRQVLEELNKGYKPKKAPVKAQEEVEVEEDEDEEPAIAARPRRL